MIRRKLLGLIPTARLTGIESLATVAKHLSEQRRLRARRNKEIGILVFSSLLLDYAMELNPSFRADDAVGQCRIMRIRVETDESRRCVN